MCRDPWSDQKGFGDWSHRDKPGHGDGCVEFVTPLVLYHNQLMLGKVLIIPVSLLWRVQIKPRQKIGLAAFLCLSVCMIIIAIIRVAGLHYQGKFDNTWIFLWQHVESCIAVTMLSLTAFRSIFVSTKPNRSPNKARPWVPSTSRLLRRYKKSTSDEKRLDDLTIPSATLTGMSAVMYRTKVDNSMDEKARSGGWPRTPEYHHEPYSHV